MWGRVEGVVGLITCDLRVWTQSDSQESEKAVCTCDDGRLYHWEVSKKGGGGFANQEWLYEIA